MILSDVGDMHIQDFATHSFTNANLGENQTEEDLKKIGWAGKPMQVKVPDDYEKWRKVYLRCLQMRRNIVASNFEGN